MVFLAVCLVACNNAPEPAPGPDPEPPIVPGSIPPPEVYIDSQKATFDDASSTYTVTTPTRTDFSDLDVQLSTEADRVLLDGQEVDPAGFKLDLRKSKTLRVIFDRTYRDLTLSIRNTGLPVVRIQTRDPVTSKEVWQEGATMRIELPEGAVDYEGTMSIRGRGNSTWNYPKKPYALKLDEKAEILSMPAHKRWVLLANWKDRTLMRNAAAFWLSDHTELPYTVRGEFVEVVLNGKHIGNYFLCEQIDISKNRVNVKEGGLLLELDTYFDEVNRFLSKDFQLPWMVKEPDEDELTPEAFTEFKQWIAELETLLKNTQRIQAHEYEQYLDVDTAIDFLIVQELTCNHDFYNNWPTNMPPGPHSAYLYKQPGGKLYSGPVWDFDYHTFVPSRTAQWAGANKTIYYPALLKDQKFRERLLERWNTQKDGLKELASWIDATAERLALSEGFNDALWPISNSENGDEKMNFPTAVNRMRKAFLDKWAWIDANIKNLK